MASSQPAVTKVMQLVLLKWIVDTETALGTRTSKWRATRARTVLKQLVSALMERGDDALNGEVSTVSTFLLLLRSLIRLECGRIRTRNSG